MPTKLTAKTTKATTSSPLSRQATASLHGGRQTPDEEPPQSTASGPRVFGGLVTHSRPPSAVFRATGPLPGAGATRERR